MPKPVHPDRRPAVVTGASSGIGAATALVLAAAGYPVALGARRIDKCEEVAETIRAAGGEAIVHPLDITEPDSVEDFVKAVSADLGDIEVLVNNAGAVGPGVVHEVDTRAVRRASSTSTWSGRTGWCTRSCPAWWSAAAVTSSSSRATSPSGPDRSCRRTPPASGGWRAWRTPCRWSSRAPGSVPRSSARVGPGARWAATGTPSSAPTCSTTGCTSGSRGTRTSSSRRRSARRSPRSSRAPRGVHLNLIEVTPEAPLEDR